ncbi:hypothetical protein AB1Y20_006798 [Prymnesium parvum]|uniref:Uncharacterized protein n=1 Tax=Prymnesium parvum TaxID=97485 RepID=A0AB34IYQ9_PRYPA
MTSPLLGAADVLYCGLHKALQPNEERWFREGYGDLPVYERRAAELMREWQRDGLSSLDRKLAIEWSRAASNDPAVRLDEGSFASPLAADLPEGPTRTARFLFVRAVPGGKLPRTKSVVVIMAATGVTDYEGRDATMARPLLEHGIASFIVMPPFNGTRSPPGQTKHYISNVADYLRQTLAIMLEGAVLLRLVSSGFQVGENESYSKLTPAVAGISWGGAMASLAALVSRRQVACMIGLGAVCPRAMATGAIRWQLDWEALRRERSHTQQQAALYLTEIFSRYTFETLLAMRPDGQATIGAVVQVAARHDHYVVASEAEQLHAALVPAVRKEGVCRLHWVDGGHVTAIATESRTFVPPCVEAIRAMESLDFSASPSSKSTMKTIMLFVIFCACLAMLLASGYGIYSRV